MSLRPFFQRLAPLLTVYLFVVSVGLPLQRVYCACVGEQWVTVLAEEHRCGHADKAVAPQLTAHDEPVATGCCHKPELPAENTCLNRDCGDTEVLLAQLDTDFTFEANLVDLGLAAVLPAAAFAEWPARPVVASGVTVPGPEPPPLPAGRDLLVAHQTFLI